jgi:iron complex transport system substrate-binding protein
MKRRLTLLAAAAVMLGLTGVAAGAPGAKPQRVMSLNMCTDQLLLQLLPADRIASVTYLSRAFYHPLISAEAAHVAVNYNSPEEVLAQHPDLVISGNVFSPGGRAVFRQAGIALLEVPFANGFDDIRTITRSIGRAVGEEDKANVLLRRMDATLAELRATAPNPGISVLGWDSGGNVPGRGTLFGEILDAAGAENVAEKTTDSLVYGSYTNFDLEQLVALGPQAVLHSGSLGDRPDALNQKIQHRVVRKLFAGRELTYPEILYRCGLPQSADAAKTLRQQLLRIARRR